MFSNEGLCDDSWHTIKVLREGPRLILQIDNDEPVTGNYLSFFLFCLYNITNFHNFISSVDHSNINYIIFIILLINSKIKKAC